jgi:multicomponent Na+:H+ antiporter subunit E
MESRNTIQRTPRRPGHRLVEALLLLVVWLLLSGRYDLMHVGLGLVSVGLVLLMNREPYQPPPAGQPAVPRLRWGRLLSFLPWLLWQMVVSALHVARVVFSPRSALHPSVIHFRSAQPRESAAVILGNSITLTPGTLTLDIAGDEYTVHCLTGRTESGLLDGSMPHRVARLFQDQPGDMVFDVHRERRSK